MDANTPIKYSDLIQPDNSIKNLQQQLKDLATQYEALMAGIRAQANATVEALKAVSGATSSGQKTIRNSVDLTDKLIKKNIELEQTRTEAAKQLVHLNAQIKSNNEDLKLSEKMANSNKDSYEYLSARLRALKKEWRGMSEEEKKNTKHGREVSNEVASITNRLKIMQAEVGNHTLSVGDYGVATANMASDIRNGIQALTQMRVEMKELESQGQKGSERWTELSQKSQTLAVDLRKLKREYTITKLETNALGQQTRGLNDVMGALSTGSGSLSAVTGIVNMFGGSASGAAEALVELNSAMAIANGISQAWNGILKSGNILLKIRNWQLALETKAQNLQTKSTIGAKAAQVALNAVAKANPYLLLAVAIGAIVTALVGWVSSGARALKIQEQLNKQTKARIEYARFINEERTRGGRENEKALERELSIAKARRASYAETQELENKIQAQKEANNAASLQTYRNYTANINKWRSNLEFLQKELLRLQSLNTRKASVQLDIEGPAQRMNVKKAIEKIQEKIDNLNTAIDIPVQLQYEKQDLEAGAKALKETHKQEILEVQALERSALREREDVQIALLTDRFKRERVLARTDTARKIQDLQIRLATENNLTKKARAAINAEIVDLQKQLAVQLQQIEADELKTNRDAVREYEDTVFAARAETVQRRRDLLKTQQEREIEDIDFRLKYEKDLTEEQIQALLATRTALWLKHKKETQDLEKEILADQLQKEAQGYENRLALVDEETRAALNIRLAALETQRQEELNANKQLAIDMRQDESIINAKYNRMQQEETIRTINAINASKLEADQAYEESRFNLSRHSEREIRRFQLKQQKEQLEAQLKAYEAMLSVQTGEVADNTRTIIDTIKNQILGLEREMRAGVKVNNIWELLGFDSDAAGAIQTVAEQVLDSLKTVAEARIEASEKVLEQAKKESEIYQRYLEIEMEARANGYANSVETARKELLLSKQKEEEALAAKKKAQKEAERIDTLTQISSLITASANIWSALSGIKFVGPALALAAVGTMFGSFAYSKIRAAQIASASEAYGEGTVELLQGGSHRSGRDIDLGTKPDGTRRRAEGGEFFAVINKRNSRKYRSIIPDVINSFNDGTFAQKYTSIYDKLGQFALSSGQTILVDTHKLENSVDEIKNQGNNRTYQDREGNTVIIYKNLKRTIKS